jgi:hypothetical protein
LFTVPPDVGLDEPAWYELLASWHYLLKVSGLAPQKAQETMSNTKPHLVSYISKADQELRQRRLLD